MRDKKHTAMRLLSTTWVRVRCLTCVAQTTIVELSGSEAKQSLQRRSELS